MHHYISNCTHILTLPSEVAQIQEMPSHKTAGARFNILAFGLIGGFAVGLYMLKDYQLIKKSPPNPENFDENGNWKPKSFIKVRVSDSIAPIELKPDVKERMLKERQVKKDEEQSSK